MPEPPAVLATVSHLQCSVPEPASSTFSKTTCLPCLAPAHHIRSSQCHSPSHSLTPISSPRTCIRVRSSLAPAFATRSTRFAGPSPLAPPLVHRHKHPHQRDGYRAAADPGGGDWGTRVARLRDGAVRGLLSREHPLACDLRQKPSAPCTCSSPSTPPTLLHARLASVYNPSPLHYARRCPTMRCPTYAAARLGLKLNQLVCS